MIIQCAWCKKVIGEKAPLNDPMVSHTICRDCSIKHFGIDPEEGKRVTTKKNPGVKYHKEKLVIARDRANKSESLREADFWQGNIHAQSDSITDSKKLGTNPKPAYTLSVVRDMWNELSNNDRYAILQTAGIKVLVAKQAVNQSFDSVPKWIQIKVVDFVNQLESESKKQNPAKKLTRFEIAERLYDLLNENSPNKVIGIAVTRYKMSLDDATKLVNEIVAVTEGKYTKLKENFKVTKKPDHVVKEFYKDVENKWNSLAYYDRARWLMHINVTNEVDVALRIAAPSFRQLFPDVKRMLVDSYNEYWKKYKKNPNEYGTGLEEVKAKVKKLWNSSFTNDRLKMLLSTGYIDIVDGNFSVDGKFYPRKSIISVGFDLLPAQVIDLLIGTFHKFKKNPGAKWHREEALEAAKIFRELKNRERAGASGVHDSKVFYEGVYRTHKRSARISESQFGINPKQHVVTILKNSSTGEYRVPGPAGTEAQAYYTDDKQDAIGTAEHMWKGIAGQDFTLKIRSISDFDRFLNDNPTSKAKQFVSKKIKILMHEGYPQKQAIAIAMDMARRAGFKIPNI